MSKFQPILPKYETIDELNVAFTKGTFKFEDAFILGDNIWKLFEQHAPKITECILNKKTPMIAYVSEQAKNILIGVWTSNTRNGLVPAGFVQVDGKDFINETERLIIEMNGEKVTIRPDQLVGDLVRVVFTGLSSPKEIQGKVDTGATVSSLHADRYTVKGTNIEFECRPLTNHVITVPLKTQHAVKSPDGGTVYRPVIELDVKINGKLIKGAMFNLNDRSNMDQPVLIGQNVLQAGKFFIDPSKTETVRGINWDKLQVLAEIAPITNKNNEQILAEFYQNMLDSDITFNELIQHIRHQVNKTAEDVE